MPAVVSTNLEPPFGLVLDPATGDGESIQIIEQYARALTEWGGLRSFPRNLEALAIQMNYRVERIALPPGTRGVRSSAARAILLSDIERPEAQRRTIAHELMHSFVGKGHGEVAGAGQKALEELCEVGAAELHMPGAEVRRQLEGSLTILDIPRLAAYFGASLAASLRAAILQAPYPALGITLELRRKKKEVAPSERGQRPLWGQPEDFDPPKRLRVHDWSASPGAPRMLVFRDKSIGDDSPLVQAMTSGEVQKAWTTLGDIGLFGRVWVECYPYRFAETQRVLALVRLA